MAVCMSVYCLSTPPHTPPHSQEADEKIKKAAQITSLRDAEVNGVLDKLKLKETELSKDVVKVT